MKGEKVSAAAASGAVALIFLILGFQIAIFSGNVFKYRQQNEAGVPENSGTGSAVGTDSGSAAGAGTDVASVTGSDGQRSGAVSADGPGRGYDGPGRESSSGRNETGESPSGEKSAFRKAVEASNQRERDYGDSRTIIAERLDKKKAESFEFDPNTVTLDELCRLGFSERQAQVILNYRNKGGRFRSEKDFKKMYVVDSAMFERLEPYIRIPKLDLNAADSEALLALKGIGPYYASKILDYRQRLGGSFSSLDQLLEIDGFDKERLDGFRSDVEIRRPPVGFDIWKATKGQLEAHPYIGAYAAKGIIRFKRTVDTLSWSIAKLVEAGILSGENAAKL